MRQVEKDTDMAAIFSHEFAGFTLLLKNFSHRSPFKLANTTFSKTNTSSLLRHQYKNLILQAILQNSGTNF